VTPDSGAGSGATAGSGSAVEPVTVIAPEEVAPAKPAEGSSGPLTLDQVVIGAANRIELNLFSDVDIETRSERGDNLPSRFKMGPIGLVVAAHLSDAWTGRVEMSFEGGGVDVERVFLEYRLSPEWTFYAGRTHAEYGYWNTAFHHGRWLQPTVDRPHMLRFEDDGGLLPVHQVGVTAIHGPPRGEAGVEVAFGVGNGRNAAPSNILMEEDTNQFKALLLRVGTVGIGDRTLRMGVNASIDKIAADPSRQMGLWGGAIYELITGAYVAQRGEHVLVLSELYNLNHRFNGTSTNFLDGFLVAGYKIDKVMPFVAFEFRKGDGATDPYFQQYQSSEFQSMETQQQLDLFEGALGLRYEFLTWATLKLEAGFSHDQFNDGTPTTSGEAPVLGAADLKTYNDYRVEMNLSFGR
jgi:hypothetical protein